MFSRNVLYLSHTQKNTLNLCFFCYFYFLLHNLSILIIFQNFILSFFIYFLCIYRKHFKFIDNIFVFFNGNDPVLATPGQPQAIVSKESLNETDENVPEIETVPEEPEQVKEPEPEPPVENLVVAEEEPKLDDVIEIDDVKSDEDSNPEKIVAFPANNDDSFMFVESKKSKKSTKDTTEDFLKSETNKLAENLPRYDH